MSATILVVEDDTIIQGLVETALRKAGHDVLLVGSGSEMFDALAGGQAIDLILLDLGLPDGDAMPHIMDIREKSEIPIVIITARGRQDDRLMALGLGADDYLTKPIDIRELALRVGNILGRVLNSLHKLRPVQLVKHHSLFGQDSQAVGGNITETTADKNPG